MASVNKQTISGDLEVSRNLITGGNLTVTGKAGFGGNVKVEGFLDAPNLKVPFKGVFESDDKLNVAYPRPLNGWFAYVGEIGGIAPTQSSETAVTYWVMAAYGLAWVSTGRTENLEIKTDIEEVKELVDEIKNQVNGMDSTVTTNQNNIESLQEGLTELEETVNGDGESSGGLVNDLSALTKRVTNAENKLDEKLDKAKVYNGVDEEGNNIASSGWALDKERGDALDARIKALAEAITGIIGEEGGEGDSLASLKALIVLLQDGKWGGTARFNGLTSLGDTTLVEGMFEGESIEGILWLTDKMMFVAVDAKVVIDCGCETIVRTYYTDWEGSRFFMQSPGEAGALWKSKIYIHNGGLYVWKECESQLVKASGSFDAVLSEEDIDEIMEGFEFVEIGTPLYDVKASGDAQLYLDGEVNGDTAVITGKLDIQDITEGDVEKMFAKAEEETKE